MNEEQDALFPIYPTVSTDICQGGKAAGYGTPDGKEYVDFMSGIAVTNLGHHHPSRETKGQGTAGRLWHVSNLFHIPEQEAAGRKLVRHSCAPMQPLYATAVPRRTRRRSSWRANISKRPRTTNMKSLHFASRFTGARSPR